MVQKYNITANEKKIETFLMHMQMWHVNIWDLGLPCIENRFLNWKLIQLWNSYLKIIFWIAEQARP